MTVLSKALYLQHTKPMFVSLPGVKLGDPLFLGVSEQSVPGGPAKRKYILKNDFFIDAHLDYGIEERVAAGTIISSGRIVHVLGIWEVVKVFDNNRVQIRPTWNYAEAELAAMLQKAGLVDESSFLQLSYQEVKKNADYGARLAA